MTFGEDAAQIRVGHGPENMASLRNFAILLLTLLKEPTLPRAIDVVAAQPHVNSINLLGLGKLEQIVQEMN
ncbi:hypothetical protein [Salininema proteolyticum]|uniref:Uncharacterized protein n=1 Tax=Salininema proteolyticum TaxID=1607685 RepID=A0ABV8U3K6_9ACTN